MTVTDFKAGPRHVASPAEWEMLREEKLGPCRCCGHSHEVTLHHLVPRSLGGSDVAENLVPLCGDGTRGCHGEWETRGLRWKKVAAAVRLSLTDAEHEYVAKVKGTGFLDRYYPLADVNLCQKCKRVIHPRAAREPARKRKWYRIEVPDDAEDGAAVLDALIEGAREKIGREPGTPEYFTAVEALAIFVRDASKETV